MSEEEDLDVKRMELVQALSELGENHMATQLFGKISKKITFVEMEDWVEHQICSTFPKVDLRDLVFCCSPRNPCPYRASVLRKLKWSLKDYISMKKNFAIVLESSMSGFNEVE